MKRRIFVVGSVMLTSVMLIAIWRFSNQDVAQSSELSGKLAEFLRGIPVIRFLMQYDEDGLFLRKLSHMVVYAILGLGASVALMGVFLAQKTVRLTMMLGTLYAVTDEVHQMFVPGRQASVRDVLIDVGGLILGLSIGVWIYQKIVAPKSPDQK